VSPLDTSQVFLIGSSDREAAVRTLFEHAGVAGLSGKSVALKANFNSADPFPASTHPDTLRALVTLLKEAGAREPKERWARIERGETHWLRGFYLSKVVLEADVVIQTCCLKTHRFGGHFTMSLKNSVGLVAKRVPGGHYDYMYELHASPFQRLMIAEINKFYAVDLVVMDAATAFVSGGPDKGTGVEPGLMLASKDRVAVDAAGVAILREFGASGLVKKPVFELEQIRRAAELGIGARSAEAVELVPLDEQGREAAARIRAVFRKG
jgi:uncharacterized protein (DUF362 family)